MSTGPYVTVKHPNKRKSLHPFFKVLYVKHKPAVRRLGAVKSKQIYILEQSKFCALLFKRGKNI